jgi:hypothetical protein
MRSSRSPTTCLVDNSKKRKVLKYGAGSAKLKSNQAGHCSGDWSACRHET